MKFAQVHQHLKDIPYILPELAEEIYQFIIDNRPRHCLELGFGHGVSSCYIAAALEELGTGHLTTVDLLSAREWQHPSIEMLLKETGLSEWVSVAREATGYNWFLQKKIMSRTTNGRCRPLYDFCFIDGAKNWTIDGLAFFLVDKLLNADGWLLFDDLMWTYRSKLAEGKTKSDGVSMLTMSEEELDHPHLELIFQLLVMQHPEYSNFIVKDYWWGWAQKSTMGSQDVKMIVSDRCLALVEKWQKKHGKRYRLPFEPYQK